MATAAWHVVWTTRGTWPPKDARGDWAGLAEFYAPLIDAGLVTSSHGLQRRYRCNPSNALLLTAEDAAALRVWLAAMTHEGGDRVAGGHPVSAAAFLPTRVHILMACEPNRLAQVIGRLKSRLAALLLFELRWKTAARIWGHGFWAAELLDPLIVPRTRAFIETQELKPGGA